MCINLLAHVPGVHGAQKRISYPLKIGVTNVVSYHLGAGTEPGSSARAISALNFRVIFPAPMTLCRTSR